MNSHNYNPDVLTCIANLSNDEVFTPPKLVNEMLDMLPSNLWKDSSATFLDPFCKSGVFLREIAVRLIAGLEDEIPDQQERINHIFKNQLFGIAITELTALLARRSVYCSKTADGKYSICTEFDDEQGNIRFERIEHTWVKGRCTFCRASQSEYDRDDVLETHAYQLIHTDLPAQAGNKEEIFNMKFDVIIGNPPYQLSDGGHGRSARPLYHQFVQQAKKLQPRYLSMIIPARWFAGGKGLNDFRDDMLNDNQVRTIVDFPDASECFPGVDIAGGICYFVWVAGSSGPCEIINIHKGKRESSVRPLNEFKTFVRHGSAIPIIRKVLSQKEPMMSTRVSSRKPFGLATNVRPEKRGELILYWNNGVGPFPRGKVTVGTNLIDSWKVITSKVSYDHAGQPDKNGMRRVFSKVEILPPKTICTETYLVAGDFNSKVMATVLADYLRTKFVRFLVAQLSFSQDITKDRFRFVPTQDFSEPWTDEKLYKKYDLTEDEIAFIESMVRPMEASDG